jgi:superfamily II DNA/RNA helicase
MTSGTTAPERSFADLGATPTTLASLAKVGIEHPFPIQTLCLPLALTGVDLIGQARTGTGKTLAFGIPIAQTIDTAAKHVQALVVVPTRELCLQVADDIETAGSDAGVKVTPIVGGRPIGAQITALKEGSQVVVGTPGRLLDHLRQRTMDLSKLRIVVLDEADEMLDLGFLPDVEAILRATPDSRQSMLFSATMPKEVIGLARRYMRQPTFVHAESDAEMLVPLTKQYFFQVHPLNRFQVLTRLLDIPGRQRAVIFRRTKRGVDRTIAGLKELGYKAGALHGDMPQQVRERVMQQFRKGKLDVLVCTDVAARGLDIAGLSHVVNYDTPEDDKAYVHRIGRTGRAGAAGVAVTFVAWNELETADLIRRRLEITDEPIREIYSTSPELAEIFGLPTIEEAAKARGVVPATEKPKPRPKPVAESEQAERPARTTVRRRRRRTASGTAMPPASTSSQAATG